VDEAKAILEEVVEAGSERCACLVQPGTVLQNSSDTDKAIAAFKHVTEIDPSDADTWYFLATVYAQGKQFPAAIEAFQHALQLNPLHASAGIRLSRAYQQSGDPDHARERLKKFQYIKDNKLGSPMSLTYGEQGQYSRAEESAGAVEKVAGGDSGEVVDVTAAAGLVSKPVSEGKELASFLGSGACVLDFDGDGKPDIFLADSGPSGGLGAVSQPGWRQV